MLVGANRTITLRERFSFCNIDKNSFVGISSEFFYRLKTAVK